MSSLPIEVLYSQSFKNNSSLFKDKTLFQTAKIASKITNSHGSKTINKNCVLKEGEEIGEGIVIDKYLFEGKESLFYLGKISSINSEILIKSFSYEKKHSSIILKIKQDFEKVKEIIGDNIISYFDYQIDANKKVCQIFMEYIPNGISLQKYFKKYNADKPKNSGLPIKQIKQIIKGILTGLKILHGEGIYPGNINPENIIVDKDLSKIKIINYALKIRKDEILTSPYYSASKKVFMKFLPEYEYENDIWSVGCITFELFCGYCPYYKIPPHEAACCLAQYISPIEAANEDIKDIFYDKKNRIVLDFLNQCFRNNDGSRPQAADLLKHKFLN
jgi:serine/threonine protein kinase